MESAKVQLVDKLKSSNNILVTVSRNPSVDQLAACLGLTLLLNKFDKHAAAVFSGEVPSTIEFLQPDATIEKNTDSLRDFIIALDKSKADKLRYKVEDEVVRIFITPYKTSISEADLDFSQGDFNVDVVVALGVREQEDLDEAITAHGRILHDATVTSINIAPDGNLGSINWQDTQASSLCELITELAQALNPDLFDNQIATALLTGIVAETERFSNQKTSSHTMSASAALMAAGADQQLVASKLEAPAPEPTATKDSHDDQSHDNAHDELSDEPPKPNDGTIEIEHDPNEVPDPKLEHEHKSKDQPTEGQNDGQHDAPETAEAEQHSDEPQPEDTPHDDFQLPEPQPQAEHNEPATPESEQPEAAANQESPATDDAHPSAIQPGAPKLVTEPPTLGGVLTANSQPEALDPVTDPFSMPNSEPDQLLNRPEPAVTEVSDLAVEPKPGPPLTEPFPAAESKPVERLPAPSEAPQPPLAEPLIAGLTPPPPAWVPPDPSPLSIGAPDSDQGAVSSLADLEASIDSPHAQPTDLNEVRDEVSKALSDSATTEAPAPIAALNAQPLGDDLHPEAPVLTFQPDEPVASDAVSSPQQPAPSGDAAAQPVADDTQVQAPQVTDQNAPPPVPPPIPFQFGTPTASSHNQQ